ncbi:MAG: hypothetical protein JNL96_08490 [Planctomycetaceae bacterium]|nr:hypothetical protein [Planctomycetaceae bacterium]
MLHNRSLPLWLHRTCNGLLGAGVLLAVGGLGLGAPADGWRHILARCLIWASVPVGIALVALTRRFSLVEGVAGDMGYDELRETDKDEPA